MQTSFISYLTSAEAARRLGLSKPGLRILVTKGTITYVETPLGLLFDPQEVERVRKARLKSA